MIAHAIAVNTVVGAVHFVFVMRLVGAGKIVLNNKISVMDMVCGLIWTAAAAMNAKMVMAALIAKQLMRHTIYVTIMVLGMAGAVHVTALWVGRVMIVTHPHVTEKAIGINTRITAIAKMVMAVLSAKNLMRAMAVALGIARAVGVSAILPVGWVHIVINAVEKECTIMPIRENAHAIPVGAVMIAKSKQETQLLRSTQADRGE